MDSDNKKNITENSNENHEDSSNKIVELQDKMQHELDGLEEKYSKLTSQINELQSDKSDLKNSIKTMNNSFSEVNKNIESILSKVNSINEVNNEKDYDVSGTQRESLSKKVIVNPLRKLTIGAISSVLTVIDKTSELTCNVRENFEDIVAEAQYQHKRRQMASADKA